MLRARGFSLLELLVVLAIIAAAMALVPPLISGFGESTELKGTARKLAAGLRSARNQAVMSQQDAQLTLDLEERRFSVTGDSREYPLPEGARVKLYTAQSEFLDESRGSVRFFPDGSSTGGHITLSNAKVQYTVNVDWLTGRIKIVDQAVP